MNKLKKIFNLYNLAIFKCIVVIIVSLYIIVNPNIDQVIRNIEEEVKIKENVSENNEEISEEQARKIAKEKFKEMDEKVKENQLEVIAIKRDNEDYYYISSEKNTMEIRKKDGKITRINSVKIAE